MKYKVGNYVICLVEIRPNNSKRILVKEPSKDSKVIKNDYLIVAVNNDNYTIIIDNDMVGWTISKFHIKYQNIDEKFLNKKFYDVTEEMILGLVTKKKK